MACFLIVGMEEFMEKVAHSRFRKGQTDYFDEGHLTHHLGNDDYKNGANDPEELNVKENPRLEGKVAEGNEDMMEDDFQSPEEKAEGKH